MTPWTDRAGRWFWPKALVFLVTIVPGIYVAWLFQSGTLALPIEQATHETGSWALRFLLASLFVTPLIRMTGWNRLVLVRRLLGLAAFFYVALHIWIYVAGQGYDAAKIAEEFTKRFYLTVGLVTALGLALLAATSSDAAISWLGARWRTLHRLVYPATALAIWHFFLQTKIDASEPTVYLGLFLLLMGYRLAPAQALRSPVRLAGVAAGAALATIALEALWYALATGVDVTAIAKANLAFPQYVRPGWVVLLTGLALAALPPLSRLASPRPRAVVVR